MKIKDLQKKIMSRAIKLAREGRDMDNGGPFGAVITKGNLIIAESCNEVFLKNDCTQHAEMRAIQKACKSLGKSNLQGCVLFTSCEPCMMCLGAAYWADFDYIYYGASAKDAKDFGFGYSDMYQKSDNDKRHQEFKMIQMCRDEAYKVWEEGCNQELHV